MSEGPRRASEVEAGAVVLRFNGETYAPDTITRVRDEGELRRFWHSGGSTLLHRDALVSVIDDADEREVGA